MQTICSSRWQHILVYHIRQMLLICLKQYFVMHSLTSTENELECISEDLKDTHSFPKTLSYLTEDLLKHFLSKTAQTNSYQLRTSKLSHIRCSSQYLFEARQIKKFILRTPVLKHHPYEWGFFFFNVTPQHLSCTASQFHTAFSLLLKLNYENIQLCLTSTYCFLEVQVFKSIMQYQKFALKTLGKFSVDF